jgi:hypothetical protein
MLNKSITGLGVAAAMMAATMGTAEAGWKKNFHINIHVSPSYGYSCGWMKSKALRAEYRGQWARADYWWSRYHDCRNGW